MKWLVSALLISGVAIACVLVFGQAPFAASAFEYQQYRDYDGTLEQWPYPTLVTPDARFLLVGPGKHGATAAGMDGERIRLKGSLIHRGNDRMVEVTPGSMNAISGHETVNPPQDLGSISVTGEIVDSKCYLGVMNPGNGKVHRDCAARCISGGIPPALVAKDASGETRTLLLVGSDGRRLNREILDLVAEPVEIRGELCRTGSTLVLKAEPKEFHRK